MASGGRVTPGLPAEQGDERLVQVGLSEAPATVGKERVHQLTSRRIGQPLLRRPHHLPGGDRLPGHAVDRFGEAGTRLVGRNVQQADAGAVSSAACSMPPSTTFMPSAAKRSAKALPIPLAPPVTTATLPAKSFVLSSATLRPRAPPPRAPAPVDSCSRLGPRQRGSAPGWRLRPRAPASA
jgi:hypothetical protein